MIAHRCPRCSEYIDSTIVERKTEKGLTQKRRPLYHPIKDEQGRIIWKNLFYIDMMSLLFILAILGMTVGYYLDMHKCNDAIRHPCVFCNMTGCCNYQTQIINNEIQANKSFLQILPS